MDQKLLQLFKSGLADNTVLAVSILNNLGGLDKIKEFFATYGEPTRLTTDVYYAVSFSYKLPFPNRNSKCAHIKLRGTDIVIFQGSAGVQIYRMGKNAVPYSGWHFAEI